MNKPGQFTAQLPLFSTAAVQRPHTEQPYSKQSQAGWLRDSELLGAIGIENELRIRVLPDP